MTVELSSEALITVDEHIRYRGVNESTHNIDPDRLRDLINMVSQEVKDFLGGRILISPSEQIEEIFHGNDRDDYYVEHKRIADPDDVVVYYRSNDTWVETDWTVEVDDERGRVYFTTEGGYFWSGKDNWKISYTPGWLQSALPGSIKRVVNAAIHRLFLIADGKEGIATERLSDNSTSYSLNELLTEDSLKTLSRYRRRNKVWLA